MPVTPSSFPDYTCLVAHKRLVADVMSHVECIRDGLREVLRISSLSTLTAVDLQILLRGEITVNIHEVS